MILNIGTKEGKTAKIELAKEKEAAIIGKKIGDEVEGNEIGFGGYVFKLTGGSDASGFPMREGVHGTKKAALLLKGGVGYNPKRKGEMQRKTIRGEVYSEDIVQVNMVVVKEGPEPLVKEEKNDEEKKE